MSDLALTVEPWLDKKGLARHFACSVRSIEFAIADGMPHAVVFGRVKARASEVEVWLEANGKLERRGDTADNPSDNGNGPAGAQTPTGPYTPTGRSRDASPP